MIKKLLVIIAILSLSAATLQAAGFLTWSDGFESGDMSEWSSYPAAPDIEVVSTFDTTGTPRTDTYMAQVLSDNDGFSATKTFATAKTGIGAEVGGYMCIANYDAGKRTEWALIYAQNEAGNAMAWAGLKLDPGTNTAKVYAHYGSIVDPCDTRSEQAGWDIVVDPHDWVKVSFRLVANASGEVDGIAIYINDQKLSPQYTDGWQSFKEIKSISFGSGWSSALAGYDDFYAMDSFPAAPSPSGNICWLWSDGFESGDMSAWTSSTNITVGAGYDYSQGQPLSGSYLASSPSSYGSVGAAKTFGTALSSVNDEVGGYLSISAFSQYRTTQWALIFAQNEAGNAMAWAGLRLEEVGEDIWRAKLYAHYGSMQGDLSLTRSEEIGWDIQVDPYEWVKVSFRLIGTGSVEGIAIYVNDVKLSLPYTNGWTSFQEIKSVKFGSGWGSALAGYDDFYAIRENSGGFGDFNSDCIVNFADFAYLAADWGDCVDPADSSCSKPWKGSSSYRASAAGTVILDGDLSEWPAFDYDPDNPNDSQWIAIDKLYYEGSQPGYLNAAADPNGYMCIMYDAATDDVYVALKRHNSSISYGWGYSTGVDFFELYMQGDINNDTPANPQFNYANAQQYIVSMDDALGTPASDDLENRWYIYDESQDPNIFYEIIGDTTVSSPSGFESAAKHTDLGGGLYRVEYEFKLKPFSNYGGFNGTTSTVQDLYSGVQFGFDLVLISSFDNGSTWEDAWLCPNKLEGKWEDVGQYGTVTCE
jgi:hypothetical protein